MLPLLRKWGDFMQLKISLTVSMSALVFAAGCGPRPEQSFSHGGYVSSISFSPDGSLLLTAGNADTALARANGGALKLWDAKSGNLVARISTGQLPSAVFAGEGKTILLVHDVGPTLGGGRRIRSEWDIEEIKKSGTVEMNKMRLEFVSKGDYVAAQALLPRGRNVKEVAHDWSFDDFRHSKDGKRFASAADDVTVHVMEEGVQGKEPIGPPLTHPHKVLRKALSPDGTLLLTLCGNWDRKEGEVRLWQVETGKVLFTRAQTPSGCLAFAPDGKMFATGEGENGDVKFWKVSGE
jgi:WD40 repeat protein